jgi:NAD/NADP transhydrogenase beta subunit
MPGLGMRYTTSVIIIPGYGLAVAQGQQKLYELVKLLQAASAAASTSAQIFDLFVISLFF